MQRSNAPAAIDLADEQQRDPFGKTFQTAAWQQRRSSEADRLRHAEAIAALDRDGYVVLERVLDDADLAAARTALDGLSPVAEMKQSEFLGHDTDRYLGLLARTPAVYPLIAHRDVVAVIEGHLDDQITLSSSTGVRIGPGESAQALHRDDAFYPMADPHPPLAVSTIWALDDFTADNGGTCVVPGSHLSGSRDAPTAAAIATEMPAGSVLLWSGSTWHGGGANVTPDQHRRAVINLYCRAWLRQQENQYLVVPDDVAREMPDDVRSLAGWSVAGATLGFARATTPPLRSWCADASVAR